MTSSELRAEYALVGLGRARSEPSPLTGASELFARRHSARLADLEAIDRRLADVLRGLHLEPLSRCSNEVISQAAALTARVFAGLEGRPENLTLLARVPVAELYQFFQGILSATLEAPSAPSMAILDERGVVRAAMLGELMAPGGPETPLPPGPLGTVFRVLGALNERGLSEARAHHLPVPGDGPVFAHMLTLSRRNDFPSTVGQLGELAGVSVPPEWTRASLLFVPDLIDCGVVHTMARSGPDTWFVGETVSPGSTMALLAMNERPLHLAERRFVWERIYGEPLRTLFSTIGESVPLEVQLEHPDLVARALEHDAGLWFGHLAG